MLTAFLALAALTTTVTDDWYSLELPGEWQRQPEREVQGMARLSPGPPARAQMFTGPDQEELSVAAFELGPEVRTAGDLRASLEEFRKWSQAGFEFDAWNIWENDTTVNLNASGHMTSSPDHVLTLRAVAGINDRGGLGLLEMCASPKPQQPLCEQVIRSINLKTGALHLQTLVRPAPPSSEGASIVGEVVATLLGLSFLAVWHIIRGKK